jgi:hypothetical protein
VDDFAHNRHVDRRLCAFAKDGQPRFRIDRPLHLVHGLLQSKPLNCLIIDIGDEIAGHDAGLRRGRAVNRRNHLDQAVFHRDLDTESTEFALGRLLHFAPGTVIHVSRMRIEGGDHAVDCAFDEFGVTGLFDIVGPDALEHLAK